MFDLSTIVINNIKGAEKKRNYIIQTMCKKIDELLGNFDEKQLAKEEAAAEKSQKEDNGSSAEEVKPLEQFEWLKLKATHESLRSKLRAAIVEKLTDVTALREGLTSLTFSLHPSHSLSRSTKT